MVPMPAGTSCISLMGRKFCQSICLEKSGRKGPKRKKPFDSNTVIYFLVQHMFDNDFVAGSLIVWRMLASLA